MVLAIGSWQTWKEQEMEGMNLVLPDRSQFYVPLLVC